MSTEEKLALAIEALKKIAAYGLYTEDKDGNLLAPNSMAGMVRAGDKKIKLAAQALLELGIGEFEVGEGILHLNLIGL